MIRTCFLFSLGFYFFICPISAQSLITQSLGSAGYVHSADSTSHLQWNVGEVVIGLTNGQDKLQQGLYQYIDITSYVNNPEDESSLFLIFPNPSLGYLSVKADRLMDYMVVHPSGRIIKKIHPISKSFTLDLRNLIDGTYYIIGQSPIKDQSMAQKWVLIRE